MRKILTTGSFLLLIIISCFSQDSKNFRLVNSDDVKVRKIDDLYTTILQGNVHFFYGDMEFFADNAKLDDRKKTIELDGNVKVYDDTLALYSKKVKYFRKRDILILRDSVFIEETHSDSTIRTFKSQRADYLRKDKIVTAEENVRGFDERQNIFSYCGYLKYDMKKNYGYMLKKPYLYMSDIDSMSVFAEKIEYFKNYKKVVANFNVITTYMENKIFSDFAIYFNEEQKAVFLGDPEFISQYLDGTAKEMHFEFQDENIKTALLSDSCRINYTTLENLPKKNWVVAKEISIGFEDNTVRTCEAFNNVESYYEQIDIENKDNLKNKTKSKYLLLELTDNEVDTIVLKDQVNGTYKFINK